mgnify:FL=1
MELWQTLCLFIYCIIVAVLGGYGIHRYNLLKLYHKHHADKTVPPTKLSVLPSVTIQIPLYNELHVAKRVIEATTKLDYPRDRLHIQVLDDSIDQTQEYASDCCARLTQKGFDIVYQHRNHRLGYKAGALASALKTVNSPLILLLDADFIPPTNLLKKTVHYFSDPKVGMVQTRWGHLNRSHSILTRIQSIFLDGHFVIEHTARSSSGRFFNFNGTAGIWRKEAIINSGGWEHDTLTEDLDLSYRAQLEGWKFIYLRDIEVPGEIPTEISSFKSQQQRWTKGAVQVSKKILPRIWRSNLQNKVKIEATLHLTANICYPLMLAMALLSIPILEIRQQIGWVRIFIIDLPLFAFSTVAISSFYLSSQRALYNDWKKQIKLLPLLMAIGMSLCINNTRAVIEGWIGIKTPFERTPKYGVTDKEPGPLKHLYTKTTQVTALLELAMAGYFTVAIYSAWNTSLYLGLPFLILFHIGFLYTGLLSIRGK